MTEPDVLEAYPYWRYQHNAAVHPRIQHLDWSGLVLRADDPWWGTHYPPERLALPLQRLGGERGRIAPHGPHCAGQGAAGRPAEGAAEDGTRQLPRGRGAAAGSTRVSPTTPARPGSSTPIRPVVGQMPAKAPTPVQHRCQSRRLPAPVHVPQPADAGPVPVQRGSAAPDHAPDPATTAGAARPMPAGRKAGGAESPQPRRSGPRADRGVHPLGRCAFGRGGQRAHRLQGDRLQSHERGAARGA